ncbi:hypothetical protein GIB67_001886 [Kingdonia uniflora]|uniref:Uncharacterized protein n=1 Tax=Kingdonia uniflora TaxID=39325 RepID=A0A7J7LQD6_9MAGN|nr:hypothetical protein GIB67_001886 [Kingdonia uniflora]
MTVVYITNLEGIIFAKHAYHVSVTQAFVEIHLKNVLKVRRSLNHEPLIRYDDPIKVMKFSMDFLGFLTKLGRVKLIQDICSQTESWSNNLIGEEFWVGNKDNFLQILLDSMLDILLWESEELTIKVELDIVITVNDYANLGDAIITLAIDSRTATNLSRTTPASITITQVRYALVRQLTPSRDPWHLKVFLSRKWTTRNFTSKEVYGLDMLFIDENEDQIHASAPIDLIS